MDDLEALTYETFERDTMKYIQYQRAVCKASLNKVLGEKAPIVTTLLMVLGAHCGSSVKASL